MLSSPARPLRTLLCLAVAAGFGTVVSTSTSPPAAAGPPAGAEFRVNTTTTNSQAGPVVAIDADGDSVVAWTSDGQDGGLRGVYFQRYNAAGTPQGGEDRATTTVESDQWVNDVAMDANGDFVITWESSGQDGNGDGIYQRRYNAAGFPQGGEALVNTTTAGSQSNSAVAMDADGNYVIAWHGPDGSDLDIFMQRYSANGNRIGTETLVNTVTTTDRQWEPDVAMDARGDFAITWASNLQDGSAYGVYHRAYRSNGTSREYERKVNTFTTGMQYRSRIAMDLDGDYVVVWASNGQDGSDFGVYSQRFNVDGVAQGPETRVNVSTADIQTAPDVAMDPSGNYAVTWVGRSDTFNDFDVFSRKYGPTGTPLTGDSRLNTTLPGDQGSAGRAAVASDADGDLLVAWTDGAKDGSGNGVYARRFRGPEPVDLRLFQSDNVDPVAIDGRVTYRIRVANLAEPVTPTGIAAIDGAIGAATGLNVVSTKPDGSAYLGYSGVGWTCASAATTVRCRYAQPLPAGESSPGLSVSYAMSTEAGTSLHPARVSAAQFDPVVSNDIETERTTVLCTWSFSAPSFSVAEAGTATIAVQRLGFGCGQSEVDFATESGTATSGSDFDPTDGTIAFDADDTDAAVVVPIAVDTLDERVEEFKVRLSSPVGALLGTPRRAAVTITDNDPPPRINFTTTSASASEPGALVEVTLRLSEVSGQATSVTLARSGTATHGTDYFAPARITIPAGERSVTFDVEVVDDVTPEGNETAVLTLTTPSLVTIGGLKTFTLSIASNEF